MIGMIIGALFGSGVVLIWSRSWPQDETKLGVKKSQAKWQVKIDNQLEAIGLKGFKSHHLILVSILFSLFIFVLTLAFSKASIPSLSLALITVFLPYLLISNLARKRSIQLRGVWPDVIDLVSSAVRAGLSIPEALSQLGDKGPEEIRQSFQEFAADYQATADLSYCLDRLKERFNDAVADRIIEAMRLTQEVGGTDLTTLLRTLSLFLREDARLRSELVARQSWTVNGAKLAVAAPWVILIIMLLRPEAAAAYDSPGGGFIILLGAGISFAAYRVMLRISRLPNETRVLA